MSENENPVPFIRAYGATLGSGVIRQSPADFRVIELPAFEPSGDGEHVVLRIRKTDANSDWVAGALARIAGVSRGAVGYAGRKDRHAVTEQWFSVHLPGMLEPDWSALGVDGVEVLEVHRHRRKVRKGALRGNRFTILIREVTAPRDLLEDRLTKLAERGFPNYFGQQRFGRDGSNLQQAREWFMRSGRKRKPRHLDLFLSAARSLLFNAVLAERITHGSWCMPMDGDRLMLEGSGALFLCEDTDHEIQRRALQLDLHPTGPLWGRGDPPVSLSVLALERRIVEALEPYGSGLARLGFRHERRALRSQVLDLSWRWLTGNELELSFTLRRGSFATSMLLELLEVEETHPSAGTQPS